MPTLDGIHRLVKTALLERRNWPIFGLLNGSEALSEIETGKIDILLDYYESRVLDACGGRSFFSA